MKKLFLSAVGLLIMPFPVAAQPDFIKDTIKTSNGNLEITFIGHGTLMFAFDGKIIHVDPFGRLTDYSKLPKADMIFVTHNHRDHLDPKTGRFFGLKKPLLYYQKKAQKVSNRNSLFLVRYLPTYLFGGFGSIL